VLEHLEYVSDSNTTRQDLLAMAGALLFRDEHIHKKIKVLSGGERARLCMAGLLLGTANVLVLDEPGNHLDVETVEALAEALLAYKGTVIFTSHDRHFMHRVATSVIEVRDGSVKNYFGDYDSYLLSVENEVDVGERERMAQAKGNPAPGKAPTSSAQDHRQGRRDQRKTEKELRNLEKKIARLDEEKRESSAKMLTETDPKEALRLHQVIGSLTRELAEIEERWLELSEEAW
jgi:ATP-binding cassette subfamily F protein 3